MELIRKINQGSVGVPALYGSLERSLVCDCDLPDSLNSHHTWKVIYILFFG